MSAIRPLPVGDDALAILPDVEAALTGTAPIAPFADDGTPPDIGDGAGGDLPDDLALVVGTSGSTGTPKLALLTAAALTASGAATHDRLGGPGQWLLAMPARHIAGIQVLARSILAGVTPATMDLSGGFTPFGFLQATAAMVGPRRYTSLVPTQLARLLADPVGTEALKRYDAVLVGGAGTPPQVLGEAHAKGVRAVTTYGMSETAGGCVYDGRALTPTEIHLEDDGRIQLGGETLAHGYLGQPDRSAEHFRTGPDGVRWFRTDDLGHLDERGRLHVDGRIDDVITTGGYKVAPRVVEEAVLAHVPAAQAAVVVASPDQQWGEAVCLAVVTGPDGPPPGPVDPALRDSLRDLLRPHLPGHALPHRVIVATTLPLRGPGKPDRRAIGAWFAP
ncbi:o-succinylbenzoate--CoA ligase [Janibacter sp. GXQ6167]|uniref:o-succinylbenzoate--CoA ligase n=1 Tax=Janibacter sp. GXQ6167 TaxID=3240791 RepID=UPI0035263265